MTDVSLDANCDHLSEAWSLCEEMGWHALAGIFDAALRAGSTVAAFRITGTSRQQHDRSATEWIVRRIGDVARDMLAADITNDWPDHLPPGKA